MSLPDKLNNFIEDHPDGWCALDFDDTVWDINYKVSENAKELVRQCQPNIAVVTFNSYMTPDKCCSDKSLRELGLCQRGKCIVSDKRWAHRNEDGGHAMVLNGENVGDSRSRGIKTKIMGKMKLKPKNTIFIDDRKSNIDPAADAGYHVHWVKNTPL